MKTVILFFSFNTTTESKLNIIVPVIIPKPRIKIDTVAPLYK